ncbi:unnamed protein product [Cyprideis torosa]|uniref:Elongation of very long chain fatty acids protein n=1 Tax=Cyprideis torosa TaxID=163714 RepID=A0A7R8ZJ57_9CRUS|nr:unnamed protein product [Cyprideis torosa]CAG0881521.1 unnamed protein product [Cyprideis torosa]
MRKNISATAEELANAYLPIAFPFEKHYDPTPPAEWMRDYWSLSILFVFIYLVVVFGVQHLMRDRKPFRLQRLLELWNACLSIFSIVGIVKVVPYVYFVVKNHGFRNSICVSYHDVEFMRPTVFWTYMFAYSKVVELGDTLFIVLRKRPLIFLHWYHHVTVLVYTWYSFSDSSPSGLWFVAMNYSVHGFMYTYYSLRAMSYRIPKGVAMSLTTLQILQMVMGCYINYSAYVYRQTEEGCMVSRENIMASTLIYGSYWALFCRFFYNAYLRPGKAGKSVTPKSAVKLPESDSNGNILQGTINSDSDKNGLIEHKNGYKKNGLSVYQNGGLTNGHIPNGHTDGYKNGTTVYHRKFNDDSIKADNWLTRPIDSKDALKRFAPILQRFDLVKGNEKIE